MAIAFPNGVLQSFRAESPVRMPEGQLPALPLTSCVILSQWLNVSVPVSSNVNGNNTVRKDNLMGFYVD